MIMKKLPLEHVHTHTHNTYALASMQRMQNHAITPFPAVSIATNIHVSFEMKSY